MSDYTFRFPFRLPKSRSISILDHSIKLSVQDYSGELYGEPEKAIKDSKTFLVTGSNFRSKEEAFEAGNKLRDALTLVFAHCKIGADFGDDSLRGGFSQFLKDKLQDEQNQRILNEVNGLLVYETNPEPLLAKIGSATAGLVTSDEKFLDIFKNISKASYSLSERERISYTLFSDSFFTSNGYARFLFLVMAVEILIDFQPKSVEAINLVESFISAVQNSSGIDGTEKDSLIGALRYLRNESIRQGACRLINRTLNDQEYGGIRASKFFLKCYDLRSSIVHGGQSFPSERDVDREAGRLEVLVANLISAYISR